MKSLFLLMTLTISVLVGTAEVPMQGNQRLNMQLDTDPVFQKMLKIYDYDGFPVREFPLSNVVNNEITVLDYMILEGSDFAFDYQGDYYYFGDSEYIDAFVN